MQLTIPIIRTYIRFNQLDSSLTASDSTPFRFGVNENGEYGYIITDSEGADTVIPFKSGNNITFHYSGMRGSPCSFDVVKGQIITVSEFSNGSSIQFLLNGTVIYNSTSGSFTINQDGVLYISTNAYTSGTVVTYRIDIT